MKQRTHTPSKECVSVLPKTLAFCNYDDPRVSPDLYRLWRHRSPILRFSLLAAFALSLLNAPSAFAQGDGQPPTIIGRSPAAGANSQAVNGNITAVFSEPIQPATISFVLRASDNTIVPSNLSYNASTYTATLDPTADLAPSRTYTVTVSGARDLAGNPLNAPVVWSFSTGQPGFQESIIFSGLDSPTTFQFASDGRVFVAQKSGLVVVFDNLTSNTPTVFADLRTKVHNFGNRGLLGMALDPGFPAVPYVYVFYTHDAPIGGVAPTWGALGASVDTCPDPTGACVVSGRVSRLQASGNVMTGVEQVLVENWYQRYPGQSVGNLAFGPDGALYAAAGDGASSTIVDYGQTDNPNPDPPNEGGALRSQDLRTPADAVTLDGSIIRIRPDTGQPVRQTTSMTVGAPTVDSHGVKSFPVVSAFQGSQSLIVRVLEPTNPAPGRPRRFLYVLPVETGVTNQSSTWGDGLEELRMLDVPNRFNLTLIAPSFNYEPWYGDHATDQSRWMESFIIRDLVPFGDSFAAAGEIPQRFVLGFSKSGNGALTLILRHPNVFSAAAAWDAPAQFTNLSAYPGLALNFGTEANFDLYEIPTLVVSNAEAFTLRNRLWISGDDAAWTADMVQLHNQLTAASIPHTWVRGGARQHSWNSGWLDGAVTALDANATMTAQVDVNEQRIVAYGLRSPRLAFRPGTQEIWVADKGSNVSEEINRIPNATDGIVENFGWPCFEGNVTTGYSAVSICTKLYSQPSATVAPYYMYGHQQQVVNGDEGALGSGAISGLAFYGSGSYPAIYQGGLFFSDYLRNNIWVMFKGTNGLPDPTNRANFLLGAASPMDLKIGPGGDLFYADLNGGTIRQIKYSTPVVRSNGQPSGGLSAGVTQTSISLTTDKNATCRYATTAGVAYGSMPNAFSTTGGLTHTTTVTGLVNGGSYSYYVRCQDASNNANLDDFVISFSVAQPADTTPPVRSNGQPAGTLSAGTSQTSLSLATNENATCRYATTAGVAYGSMPNAFSTTGGLTHTTTVTGLVNSGSYSYYVRCQDVAGNANTDDLLITFSVAGVSATSNFSGIENPLSENGIWDSPGSWADLQKNNGAFASGTPVVAAQARLTTPLMAADQYSEITYDQDPSSSSWVGATTRVQTGGSCYLAIVYAGEVRLYRTDDTGSLSYTLLASASVNIGASPRRLRLESQGNSHRVYFNGVQVISHNASGTLYSNGQPGIAAALLNGGVSVKILSFQGGAIGTAADTTPPVRSNGQPVGTLSAGISQTSLSLATNENATCRYATTAGVAYGSMPNAFSTTGGLTHTTTVTGLVNGGSYSYYVRCQDASNNANLDDFVISFSVAQPADTTPPVRSNGQPAGTLSAGTSQTSLSLATNENATCRYATTAGVAYGSMPNAFSTTGGLTHTTTVTGLVNSGSYSYYVRCQDVAGNANTDDLLITFSVAGVSATSNFSGIENPLSENGIWDSPGSWADLQKNNGAFASGTPVVAAQARLMTPLMAADQYSEITYDQDPSSSSWVGATTRVQTGGSCYLAIVYAGEVRLYRTDDTGSLSYTLLASASVNIGASPRRLRLESQGNSHRVYFNGVQVISHNASGTLYSNGQPGIAAALLNGGVSVKILSFQGGAIGTAADTTPPVRSNGQPAGTLSAGTSQTSLSLATNENATCRYATTAGVAYGSMPNAFSTTGGLTHTTTVTGLVNSGSYSYYVRCQDVAGNANTDDLLITFSVAGVSATSNFSGIENPLSENGIWDSPGSWADLQKNNGAFASGTPVVAAQARLMTPLMAADQYSEITYDQDPSSSSWVGATTRVQTGGSCYLAIVYAGEVRLYRTDDTGSLSYTLLASASVNIGASPRRLRLESQGNSHRVYFNGVQVISHNASGTLYSNGQPGIAAALLNGGVSVKILSFQGGAI